MPEKYDLHCHSKFSDGSLSPAELIRRAADLGVTRLALTDHDTTAGLTEAAQAAAEIGITLINGIELSTSWQGKSFHVVGLGIDPDFPPLREATQNLVKIRRERAEKIAARLQKKRIEGALEWVLQAAGDGMITRTHFADFLVAQFHVGSQQEAFDRYLAKGKPAYAPTEWADMAQAVDWISRSGGVAVLAHPLRYKLSANWMKKLLTAFKQVGGQAIEVVTGRSNADEIRILAAYAVKFELAGSVGSDFHSPDNPWVELGRLAPLPLNVKPVWQLPAQQGNSGPE
jgi:predicted metal-dependent phosphoesterase TrpH